jgi:hypothetical protein
LGDWERTVGALNALAVHAGRVIAMASQHNQLTDDQAQLATRRDVANWATAVRRLQVSEVPDGSTTSTSTAAGWSV